MKQSDIDRAVAATTGESLKTIAQLGFGIADPAVVEFDPEPCDRPPLVVDWDALDAERYALTA